MAHIERSPEQAIIADYWKRKNIKVVLTDLDDTLVDSHAEFSRRRMRYAQYIADTGGHQVQEVMDQMTRLREELRKIYSVSPAFMNEIARLTALQYGVPFYDPDTQTHLDELMEVYTGKGFKLLPGAKYGLNTLRGTGIRIPTVTHASEGITWGKIEENDMRFRPTDVFCIDIHGPKGPEQWAAAHDFYGVSPEEVFILGDNWRSDILPNMQLGVPTEHMIRVETHYTEASDGAIEGVQQIAKIGDLIPALIERATRVGN